MINLINTTRLRLQNHNFRYPSEKVINIEFSRLKAILRKPTNTKQAYLLAVVP